jgi:hypothetical protein
MVNSQWSIKSNKPQIVRPDDFGALLLIDHSPLAISSV